MYACQLVLFSVQQIFAAIKATPVLSSGNVLRNGRGLLS